MPIVKFTEVISYSSEDSNYQAQNLLKSSDYSKWLCSKGTNEKQAWVSLKLEQLVSIQCVDIGNENSALIEVLVAREGVDFQVLLVASSFMTPGESRGSTNTNRVRMFNKDKLTKPSVDQKWDRVKIVCTQPFAKNVQYGLTFIKIHASKEDSKPTSDLRLGQFTLRDEESESNAISIGTFFAKRKEEQNKALTGAAAIRAASNDLKEASSDSVSVNANKASSENPPSLGFYQLKKPVQAPECTKREKARTHVQAKEHQSSPKLKDKTDSSPKLQNKTKEHQSSPKLQDKPSNKKSNVNVISKRKSRPFNQLMSGVVFVMSGYKNPQRSDLRDKMINMGAKYKGDWEDSCTHLICAFRNTPKFQAVKGKGKIVSEKWIEESYKRMIALPWRRYNLEKNRDADDSEEEVYATELLKDKERSTTAAEAVNADSDEDTDEEIERVMNENKRKIVAQNSDSKKLKLDENVDSLDKIASGSKVDETEEEEDYDADTDVDEEEHPQVLLEKPDTCHLTLPPLEDFFVGKTFFLYGSLSNGALKSLRRYIIAHGGKISNYMSDEVHFVLTEDAWDANFDDALNEHPSLQFVKPQWVWKCCDKVRLIPPQPYLIVPYN